jgi:DNA-binding transcriptional ArsR family regulator
MNTAVALERPLQTGDLSEAAVQAWLDFVAMPSHERCLRLTWMAESRAQAAVLWRVSEHHRMTKRLGTDLSYKSISAHDIARRFGLLFGCSQRSIGQALSDLLDEGMLLARPHVDNVTRKIWLHWPALQKRWQSTEWPDRHWLELNWIAKNKAEMVVLHSLQSALVDGQQDIQVPLSPRELERLYRPQLGAGVDSSAISRAVKALTAAGAIEQPEELGIARGVRLVPGQVEAQLQAFYQQDLQKLLG